MMFEKFDAHFPEDLFSEDQRSVAWEAWNISIRVQKDALEEEHALVGRRRIAVTDKQILDFVKFVLTSAGCLYNICPNAAVNKFRSMLDVGRKS